VASYMSNTPISGPIWHSFAKPDVDLNGIGWSYQYGMVFNAPEREEPIKLPVGISPQDYE
jgi:hypothetical protein